MEVTKFVEERRILSLLLGTIILQGVFLSVSFYHYRTHSPDALVARKLPGESAATESVVGKIPVPAKEAPPLAEEQMQRNSESDSLSASSPTEPSASEKDVTKDKPKPFTYLVEKGDTLAKIWQKNGGSYAGALSAANAFKELEIPLSSLRPGDKIMIVPDESGDIKKFSKRTSDGKTIVLSGSSKEGYKGKLIQEKIEERERTVTGTVLSSFSDAAQTSVIPLSVVDEFVDLFGDRLEFRKDFQPGDTFTIVYTQRRLKDGSWLEPGPIKAASIKLGTSFKAALRYTTADGKSHVFDETGQPLGSYFLRYPVKFTRISSVFTDSRFHPLLGIKRPHNGVDFAAPSGTPVRTVGDGVVESAGFFGSSGNMVKIRHNARYSTAYLHLSKIAPGIRKGARVSRGQFIGNVGTTGLSTGPHLHFSLYDGDTYTDPMKAKLPSIIGEKDLIPPQYLQTTLQNLKKQHDILTFASAQGASPRA